MFKILAVNPACSSKAERKFLLARRVKTWMQSTMLPARFNSASMLNFNKKSLDYLDIVAIVNLFAVSKENRKRNFRKFTKKDLANKKKRFTKKSFSIYLVSLSLYSKLTYKVLFKRHLMFVANVNPVFLSLCSLEARLYLYFFILLKPCSKNTGTLPNP